MTTAPMNSLSVCDGIGAAEEACKGLPFHFLMLAEIEGFPRSVLQQRHRAIDQRHYDAGDAIDGHPCLWGDFTTIRPRHLRRLFGHADVDFLFGGTPCQSFSVAGKRTGLDDPRGDLSLEYALLAFRLGVRGFLWENVPGVLSSAGGEDFAAILSAFTGRVVAVPAEGWRNSGVIPEATPGHFGVAWRTFDAQYAGVPQRRRRIFVVGHLGNWRRAVASLLDLESLQGNPAPRREAGQGATHPTAPCLTSSGRGVERTSDTRGQDPVVAVQVAPTMRAGGNATGGNRPYGTDVDTCDSLVITHALRADGFDASEDGTGRGTPLVVASLTSKPYANNEAQHTKLIPVLANTMKGNRGAGGGLGPEETLIPVAFSCKDHGADAGDLAPTLRSMGSAESHANGGGQLAVAFVQNSRDEVRMMGGDGQIVGALAAEPGMKQQSYVAFNLRGREGGAMPEPADLASIRAASGGSSRTYVGIPAYGISNQPTPKFGRDIAPSLDAKDSGGGRMEAVCTPQMAVRRLTVVECERLMGQADNYTAVLLPKGRWRTIEDDEAPYLAGHGVAVRQRADGKWQTNIAADGPRYKSLGNSWEVNTVRWIVERIAMLEAMEQQGLLAERAA